MTETQYKQLVAAFKETMERGEKDQWALAEYAYQAIDGLGVKPTVFAKDTGYAPVTIKSYRKVWAATLKEGYSDTPFGDLFAVARMSPERAEAVEILAEIDGKSVSTVKRETERIAAVRTFIAENADLMALAMKDEGTRKEVIAQAFVAASEETPAASKTPRGEATPKPKRFIAQEEMTALRYKTINSGIWGRDNLPMIVAQMATLEQYITDDDVDIYMDNLRPAYDAMLQLWDKLEALKAVKVGK